YCPPMHPIHPNSPQFTPLMPLFSGTHATLESARPTLLSTRTQAHEGHMTRLLPTLRLSTSLHFPATPLASSITRHHTLLVLLFTLCIALHGPGSNNGGAATAMATTKSARGLLKLCPPGGESFANAWQITCGMKRRKKREATPVGEPSNSTSIS